MSKLTISFQHLDIVVLLEAQVEARCRAGFGEASLELGRHTHLGGRGREWKECGRKPEVGVKPDAKGEGASKSRKSRPPPGL